MARIEKSIEVSAPLRTVYNQWTQFEQFPRFMEGVTRVQQLDATHLRWHASVAGKEKQWDSEITEQLPDRRIAWRSSSGARNEGTVQFRSLDEQRTLVWLTMEYDPEGFVENVGDALGVMSRRVQGDLERFKDFIESRGRETGQWRGEVHHGREAPPGASRGEQWRRGPENRPMRFGNWPDVWQDPLSSLRRMTHEMELLFDRLLGTGAPRGYGEQRGGEMQDLWTPHVEVVQRGDELVISADLPGTKKEDVQVEVDEGRLVIQGERRSRRETTEGGVQRSERTYGQFYREIPLPRGADTEGARASLEDGVLEIRVRVPGRRQGRRLTISEPARAGGQQTAMQGAGATQSAPGAGSTPPVERSERGSGTPPEGGEGSWHLGR
jgi:HSP20 family molecular chaperone IbpA